MIPFQLAILKRLGARELRPYARFAGSRGSLAQGSRLVHRVPLPLRRFRTSLAYGPVNPSNSSASSQIPGFPRAGDLVSPSGTSASSQILGFPHAGELVSPLVPLPLRRSQVSLAQGSRLVRRFLFYLVCILACNFQAACWPPIMARTGRELWPFWPGIMAICTPSFQK